ncbi:hypothetical protein T439DRAFT_123657 [Meredithblackwellia eburnea MCA 4105]
MRVIHNNLVVCLFAFAAFVFLAAFYTLQTNSGLKEAVVRSSQQNVEAILDSLRPWTSWADSERLAGGDVEEKARLDVVQGAATNRNSDPRPPTTVTSSSLSSPVKGDTDQVESSEGEETSQEEEPAPKLPCERTLLFHFGGQRGFTSEYNRFIRVTAVASHFGYEVIPVATDWMYGEYEDYFKPPELSCTTDTSPTWEQRKAVRRTTGENLSKPAWTRNKHVQDGGYNAMDYFDEIFLAISTSPRALAKLHNQEIAEYPPTLPLSGIQTVPTEILKSFEMLARQVQKYWILQDDVQKMVDALREGLRLTSESESSTGTLAGRPPVIGLHIRLGDKCSEMGAIKYSPLRFATPAQLAEHQSRRQAANQCSEQAESGGLDETHARIYLDAADEASGNLQSERVRRKPVLAIMSDDVGGLEKLRNGAGEQLDEFEPVLLSELAKDYPAAMGGKGGKDMDRVEKGFQSGQFPKLSLETRVTATKRFLRDLTVVGREADSIVFTGSSNVGRLAALIGGAEKATQGRFLSCDSRWYGTAHWA